MSAATAGAVARMMGALEARAKFRLVMSRAGARGYCEVVGPDGRWRSVQVVAASFREAVIALHDAAIAAEAPAVPLRLVGPRAAERAA
jgi:hypothetical protein